MRMLFIRNHPKRSSKSFLLPGDSKIVTTNVNCLGLTPHLPRRWRNRLEGPPRKRKVGCSNSSRGRHKSLKQVVTFSDRSTVKRLAIVVSGTGLGDDHFKRMPRVTVVWHVKEPFLLNGHGYQYDILITFQFTIAKILMYEHEGWLFFVVAFFLLVHDVTH